MTAGPAGAPEDRASTARVVMMVGNDIRHDTRVLKTGLALSDAGLEVTLLGYASSGVREETTLGRVRIIRVPVAWRLRDAAIRLKKERRQPRLKIAADPARRRAQDLRANLRRQELVLGGRAHRLRSVIARAGREGARVRAGVDRRVRRLEARAWATYDAASHRTGLAASWRRVLPEIDDYELAFGPVLDQLEWDVLHAHDVHLVGVAARAVARRRAAGRSAAWVYDAHEYVKGLSIYGPRTQRKRAAYLDLEREFIRGADAVVTVTEPLARRLQEQYHLPRKPAVVMNSPVLGAGAKAVRTTIRDEIGLDPGVPLAVYSGGVTAARGIATAVEALSLLPGWHLAVVSVPHKEIPAAKVLAAQAAELGVSDRLHLLDPVAPDEVSAYVATADVGLLPILHFGSHEVALPNKIFEYLYGGVPLLVSDTRASAEFVRSHGVGAVHVAGDADDFARQLRWVLDHAGELRRAIADHPDLLEPYAWDRQEATLREVYRELLGPEAVREPTAQTALDGLVERAASRADRDPVIGIGPANMAGQGWAWAKALERHVPGVRTEVMAVDRGSPLTFEADRLVPAEQYAKDARWAQAFEAHALQHWTHALLEAGRPMFGLRHGRDFTGDVPVLRAVGIEVGLLLHGSEIRNPRRHAESTIWSPFRDPEEELTARLQRQWEVLHPLVMAFDGPVFVSTPDLLDDVPGATLLPVVVDVAAWLTDRPVLERDRPVVLHAPSRASIKGTNHVESAVAPLVAEGLVEYRRVEGLAPGDMPAAVADADIVLDQFSLGSYGVMAVQAMAAGRVVVGHVTDRVRSACPEPLPVVEGAPDSLPDVLRGIVKDREAARESALAGRGYAERVHGGALSAAVLAETLGLRREGVVGS